MQTLISIEGLTKRYPKSDEFSLKGVSLSIRQGERFGIFGPNGAGKTTLISILCQILTATEGRVRYFIKDREVSFSDIKQHIGFVPQDLALYEDLPPFRMWNISGPCLICRPNAFGNARRTCLIYSGFLRLPISR